MRMVELRKAIKKLQLLGDGLMESIDALGFIHASTPSIMNLVKTHQEGRGLTMSGEPILVYAKVFGQNVSIHSAVFLTVNSWYMEPVVVEGGVQMYSGSHPL